MKLVCLGGLLFFASSSPAFWAEANEPSAGGFHIDSTKSESSTIVYTNKQYGFTFTLPASWKGYKIVRSTWESDEPSIKTEHGPMVAIRNPHWTKASMGRHPDNGSHNRPISRA